MNYRSLDREATINLNLQAKYIVFIAYRPISNSQLLTPTTHHNE
jgi:hypothetical protein